MADDAVSVARRFLTAEFNLDPDGMCAELADDVVLELPHAFAGIPGRYEGKVLVEAMIRGWIPSWWSELRSTGMDVRQEADPERAVAEYSSVGVVASNGAPYKQNYAGMFIVRNGKITYHAEYFDPIPVMRGMDLI